MLHKYIALASVSFSAVAGLAVRNSAASSLPNSGIATFFYQQGLAGACGAVHKDSDFIVSLNIPAWANGAHCGQTVKVADASTGKTVTVTVADECPTCGAGGIDLSVGAFEALTGALFPESASVTWGFV